MTHIFNTHISHPLLTKIQNQMLFLTSALRFIKYNKTFVFLILITLKTILLVFMINDHLNFIKICWFVLYVD